MVFRALREERRERGEMFKIHKKLNKVELSSLNTSCYKNYTQICGSAEAVVKKRRSSVRFVKEFIKKCTVRETFFTKRVAEAWNNLGDDVLQATTVNGFKARCDKSLVEK